jgi:hypothetical protein
MSRPALLALLVRAVCSVLLCSFPVAACKGDAGAAPKAVSADAGTAAAASSACAEGYEKKGGKCVDIDECGGVANVCGPHPEAKCSNKPGTYECACPEGFVGGGPGGFGCSAGLAQMRVRVVNTHVCRAQPNGTVRCWKGERKKLVPETFSPFSELRDVADLQFNAGVACALLRSGRVACWGENGGGEVGDGTTATPRLSPVELAGVERAVALSVSASGGCALLHNGTVSCWGPNVHGALGRGSVGGIGTPAPVSGLSGVAAITADIFRTCAVLRTGALRCWGINARSEMKGSRANSALPVDFSGLKPALDVSMGMNSTCVLHADRTVSCWGNNLFGQLGDGTQQHSDVPVAVKIDSVELLAGGSESQRAVRGGELYIWGRDLVSHPGQDSGGYVAEDVESIRAPRKVQGLDEVKSLIEPWCVVMSSDRLACGTASKHLENVVDAGAK